MIFARKSNISGTDVFTSASSPLNKSPANGDDSVLLPPANGS